MKLQSGGNSNFHLLVPSSIAHADSLWAWGNTPHKWQFNVKLAPHRQCIAVTRYWCWLINIENGRLNK